LISKRILLDSSLSVTFTLYELWKELKRNRHTYSYPEIIESLRILSKVNILIKQSGKKGKVELSSNMFETFGAVDNNEQSISCEVNEEKSKKIIYYVRFNALVTRSIREQSWRLYKRTRK
jgi:hypothetical protein